MTNETVDNRLTDFLKEGKDWERKQTNVPGVFLLKLPPFRSRPACIAIEIDAFGRGEAEATEEEDELSDPRKT